MSLTQEPAFYNRPQTIDDLVMHLVSRILDLLEIPNNYTRRWGELVEIKSEQGL